MRTFALHFNFRPADTLELDMWEIPYLLKAARLKMREAWMQSGSIAAAVWNTGFRGSKRAVSVQDCMPSALADGGESAVPTDWEERLDRLRKKTGE